MKYRIRWFIFLLLVVSCGRIEAELDTLGKLRMQDWDVWLDEGGYDLALMGDDAAPFLVNVLTDENEDARWHANFLLDRYYADPKILPELTNLFLTNTDKSIRSSAMHLIASIDPKYARQLIAKYLDDPNNQNIAVSVLSILKDERVIPLLVESLKDSKNPLYSAYRLADFKDKRAVPILLEALEDPKTQSWTRDEVIEKLAYIGDERTLPILLNLLDKQDNNSYKIKTALSQSEPSLSLIRSLLKTVEEPNIDKTSYRWNTLLDIIANQKNPELIPYYEKLYYETTVPKLQNAVVRALGNMGEKGFESLLNIVRWKPSSTSIKVLATYNSEAAIDAITSLALDESFTYQTDAIQSFLHYGGIWHAKVSNHIPKLLKEVSPKDKLVILDTLAHLGDTWKPFISKHLTQLLTTSENEVRILAIDLIRRMNFTLMAPALENLMRSAKGNSSDAAHMVYDLLHNKSQLELIIEFDQQRYDYEQPITLTYRIRNVSDYPVYIALYKSLASSYVKLKIQQPDKTFAKYIGPIAVLRTLTFDDINTMQPGDEITGTIPILDYYDLYQPGVYTIQLQISPGLRGVISKQTYPLFGDEMATTKQGETSLLTWSNTLISTKGILQIKPIPDGIYNEMIRRIDPEMITEENRENIINTCDQLAEIGKPKGIAAVKKLALMDTKSSGDFRHDIKLSALHLLFKFPDPDLVQARIDTFDIGHEKHTRIEALGASGDRRAIEPLRRITFKLNNQNISTIAAQSLQQLGDESGVIWLRKIAYRKLRHWKHDERQSGAVILVLLQSPDKPINQRLHNLRNPWFYAQNYDQSINWSEIHEKSTTNNGLKELLQHKNLIIQRSAAYELAYLGDKIGIHLIQQDLHAAESATRMHARDVLSKLQK